MIYFMLLIPFIAFSASIDVLSLTIDHADLEKCFPIPKNKEVIFGDPITTGIKFFYDSGKGALNIQARWEPGEFRKAATEWDPLDTQMKVQSECILRQGEDTQIKIINEKNYLVVSLKDGDKVRSLTAPPPKFIYEGELVIKKPISEQPVYSQIKLAENTNYKVWVLPGQKFYVEVLASPGYHLREFIQTGMYPSFQDFLDTTGLWKEVAQIILASAGGEEGLKQKLLGYVDTPPHVYRMPAGSDELELSLVCMNRLQLKSCHMSIGPDVVMKETKRTKYFEPPSKP